MAEKKETDLQAILVIVAIATVCAGGLALVKAATADRIEQTKLAAEKGAVGKVLPPNCEADTEKKVFWNKETGVVKSEAEATQIFYPGFADGKLCGLAVKTRAERAYSGKIVMLIGLKQLEQPEMLKMHRLYVLEQTETPGLGAKVADGQSIDPDQLPSKDPKKFFCMNFYDKELSKFTFDVKQTGYSENDVAAITASTITSKAVAVAVKEATEMVRGKLPEITALFEQQTAQK